MNSSQCYKLLGLNESASVNEIKNAYRKLALEYHPDKNISARDGVKFKMISEAYHTLRIKDNAHTGTNYETNYHNKNHQYKEYYFQTCPNLLYSKVTYMYKKYAKNICYYYFKYEPVFLKYCDKMERNASILIHRLIIFFRHDSYLNRFSELLQRVRQKTYRL